MWTRWWTSRKSRRGNVNSLLRCSTFVLCWHICFLTSLVSRFQSKACKSFGTMLEATSHGARTILQLQLLSMYQWDFMEIAPATPTKLDSQRNCSASPWAFPSGIRSPWGRVGSWSVPSENPSWSTMFEHYGRSTGTSSPNWTSSSMLAFRSNQSRSAPTRQNASQWRSWGATGPTTATRTSCFGDGTRATSASSARRPWQAARSNIRILRTQQLGLGMNIPIYSSSTDASNPVQFVTWLYIGSGFQDFVKNTGDFTQFRRNKCMHCETSGMPYLGPLFGLTGFHAEMIRFCWTHNWHLGLFHRSNASAMLFGDASTSDIYCSSPDICIQKVTLLFPFRGLGLSRHPTKKVHISWKFW